MEDRVRCLAFVSGSEGRKRRDRRGSRPRSGASDVPPNRASSPTLRRPSSSRTDSSSETAVSSLSSPTSSRYAFRSRHHAQFTTPGDFPRPSRECRISSHSSAYRRSRGPSSTPFAPAPRVDDLLALLGADHSTRWTPGASAGCLRVQKVARAVVYAFRACCSSCRRGAPPDSHASAWSAPGAASGGGTPQVVWRDARAGQGGEVRLGPAGGRPGARRRVVITAGGIITNRITTWTRSRPGKLSRRMRCFS